jgi:hypothetical protein
MEDLGYKIAEGEVPIDLICCWESVVEFVDRSGIVGVSRACNIVWEHDCETPEYDVVWWKLKENE